MSQTRILFSVNQITSYDTEIGAIAEKRLTASVSHFKTALEAIVCINAYGTDTKYHKFVISKTTIKDYGVYASNIEHKELIEEARKEISLFDDKFTAWNPVG